MCRENPLWGAPRVHTELPMLGIEITLAEDAHYNGAGLISGGTPTLLDEIKGLGVIPKFSLTPGRI